MKQQKQRDKKRSDQKQNYIQDFLNKKNTKKDPLMNKTLKFLNLSDIIQADG